MSKKVDNKQAELFKACLGQTIIKTVVCNGGYKRVRKESK